jgi:hypothetical protein
MNDFSPVMIKHHQGVQDPKRRGRDNKHVDRHRVSQVVVQEAAPSRGGSLGAPRQIPPARRLADIDPKLEQFASDARCAPERLGRAHPADQVADFGIRLGSTTAARSPSPVETRALVMPSGRRRWFDEYRDIEELRPQSIEPNAEQTVS